MKLTPFFALAAAALLTLAGCGAEAENMSAQYPPPPPVGTDAEGSIPTQGVAASEMPVGQIGIPTENAAESVGVPQQGDLQIGAEGDEYVDTDPAALTDFKPALEPYGTWADDSTYGTVWTPSTTVVGDDFSPYVTAGHWTYDDDYVWVSDYDWGWAPFHYGRWVYITSRGWSWIPGRRYAGAWVSWRYGYDDWGYVGWAPMAPSWYWRGGYAVGVAFMPVAPYTFCHSGHLFQPGFGGGLVAGAQVPVVASHTRPWVPANPSVNGGMGGHVGAHPTVGGPPPKMLGLNDAQIAHPPMQDRGLMHAQQFSRPASAQALGARPPVHAAVASSVNGAVATAPRWNGGTAVLGRTQPYGASVATAPQYRGITPSGPRPVPYTQPRVAAGAQGSAAYPRYQTPPAQRYAAPGYSAPHYSAPAYSAPSAPHYSAPAYAAPRYSAPAYSAPSAPRYSAPAYSAPSAPHYSAPSGGFHTSAPSHSSGGGFHGGGRSGGRR